MITIVFSHPWHGSFNKAILDTITAKLAVEKREFEVIDLHKDGFNPVFSEAELSVYNQGKALDPLVLRYQEYIGKTDQIVFIFPNWWNTIPGILKGFFDKVLLKDFAFNYEGGFNPLLSINKTLVVTTSEHPSANFDYFINHCFAEDMLASVGIRNMKWLSCTGTSHGGNENRTEFLRKVEEAVSK
ncbi:MAG: NAD(P)H dehydrogenase [Bacteroidales bacterium 45-6]|nr:MAG: NAD(P)H dehydrogenase [Bacteroidales bacterium 45-6]